MNRFKFLVFSSAVLLAFSSETRAESAVSDALLTVGAATLGGAILGASTLPFYEESTEHTNNILYGAAIGAVVGVLISAYSGVKEGPNYEDARLAPRKPSALAINESPASRLKAESSIAIRQSLSRSGSSPAFWTSVASLPF